MEDLNVPDKYKKFKEGQTLSVFTELTHTHTLLQSVEFPYNVASFSDFGEAQILNWRIRIYLKKI